MDDEWLTTKEACKYLKIHRRTLYRMMGDGRLPFCYISGSGHRRIRKADVDALLIPAPPRVDTDKPANP
jgi:excisionase family DNA binding protein